MAPYAQTPVKSSACLNPRAPSSRRFGSWQFSLRQLFGWMTTIAIGVFLATQFPDVLIGVVTVFLFIALLLTVSVALFAFCYIFVIVPLTLVERFVHGRPSVDDHNGPSASEDLE